MKKPVLLRVNGGSRETVTCLETLLASAKAREMVGLAFVAFLPRKRYQIGTSGIADDDPTHALGATKVLADDLSARIRMETD